MIIASHLHGSGLFAFAGKCTGARMGHGVHQERFDSAHATNFQFRISFSVMQMERARLRAGFFISEVAMSLLSMLLIWFGMFKIFFQGQ